MTFGWLMKYFKKQEWKTKFYFIEITANAGKCKS